MSSLELSFIISLCLSYLSCRSCFSSYASLLFLISSFILISRSPFAFSSWSLSFVSSSTYWLYESLTAVSWVLRFILSSLTSSSLFFSLSLASLSSNSLVFYSYTKKSTCFYSSLRFLLCSSLNASISRSWWPCLVLNSSSCLFLSSSSSYLDEVPLWADWASSFKLSISFRVCWYFCSKSSATCFYRLNFIYQSSF